MSRMRLSVESLNLRRRPTAKSMHVCIQHRSSWHTNNPATITDIALSIETKDIQQPVKHELTVLTEDREMWHALPGQYALNAKSEEGILNKQNLA